MKKGLGLVEVLVALAIFALVLSAIVPAFIQYLKTNSSMEVRTQAVAIAQQVFEELRGQDPSTLPDSGTTEQSVTYQGRSYKVRVTYCPSGGFCTSTARSVKVDVEYQNRSVYAAETVFTKLR